MKAKLKNADQVIGAFRRARGSYVSYNLKNLEQEKLNVFKSWFDAFGVKMPGPGLIDTVQSSQNVKIQLGVQGQSSCDASGQVSDGVEPKEEKEEKEE